MSSLAICHLPSLVFESIIGQMDARELYNLGRTSRKMKNAVKWSLRYQKFVMKLFFMKFCPITLKIKRANCKTGSVFSIPDISNVPAVIETMASIFKNPVISIFGGNSRMGTEIYQVVSAVQRLNLKLYTVLAVSDGQDDKMFKFLINELKSVPNLRLHCERTPEFECDIPHFSGDFFELRQANWFTVNHLINSFWKCKRIDLYDCGMSAEAYNQFVREWMKGESSIETMWCYYFNRTPDFQTAMEGIPSTSVQRAFAKNKFLKFGEHKCYLIKNDFGTEALVFQRGSEVYFTTKFELDRSRVKIVGREDDTDYEAD